MTSGVHVLTCSRLEDLRDWRAELDEWEVQNLREEATAVELIRGVTQLALEEEQRQRARQQQQQQQRALNALAGGLILQALLDPNNAYPGQ